MLAEAWALLHIICKFPGFGVGTFLLFANPWRHLWLININNINNELINSIVTSKNCAYRDSNSDCFSRVRRSAGLSIPGWDTDCMSCSVFICALRSLYSALKSIPLQYLDTILRYFTRYFWFPMYYFIDTLDTFI